MPSQDFLARWRERTFGPHAVPVQWPDGRWRVFIQDDLRGRGWYALGEWPSREEAARAALLWERQEREAS
jgi:hypothetical protein